jgi:hypothetical protein
LHTLNCQQQLEWEALSRLANKRVTKMRERLRREGRSDFEILKALGVNPDLNFEEYMESE